MENKKFIIAEDIEGKSIKIETANLEWRISVYGILIKERKVLLVKSIYSDSYFLPGGKVDKSENLKSALKREFTEETGLTVSPISFVHFQEDFFVGPRGGNFHTLKFYYFVDLSNGEIQKKDPNISMIDWVPIEKINEKKISPQIQFLPHILSEIR